MAKDKADIEAQPTPVDFRNLFKGEKGGVIVRTLDDKKLRLTLPKFTIDDIDELTNARDYLDEIIEDLEDEEEDDDDDEDDDDEDDDDDEEEEEGDGLRSSCDGDSLPIWQQ